MLDGHSVDSLRRVDFLHIELIRGKDLDSEFLRLRIDWPAYDPR